MYRSLIELIDSATGINASAVNVEILGIDQTFHHFIHCHNADRETAFYRFGSCTLNVLHEHILSYEQFPGLNGTEPRIVLLLRQLSVNGDYWEQIAMLRLRGEVLNMAHGADICTGVCAIIRKKFSTSNVEPSH